MALRTALAIVLPLAVLSAHDVRADDDDDDDEASEPTATWRISVDVSASYHDVLHHDSSVLTQDHTWTVHDRVLVELPQSRVSGPNYGLGTDVPKHYLAESESGTVKLDDVTTFDGKKMTENKLSGSATPGGLSIGLSYVKPLDSWRFEVKVGFVSSGTAFEYGKPAKNVTNASGPDFTAMASTGKLPGASRDLKVTRHGAGFVVDYHWTNDTKTKDNTNHQDVVVHATFEPKQESPYVAVIRPADPKEYLRWVPQGPKIPGGDDARGGNHIDLVAEIRDRKTGKPAKVSYSLTWKITSSKQPGWCMNYPRHADANDHWDLFFDPKQNPTRTIVDDGESFRIDNANGFAIATVSARDYGAYGRVDAFLTLSDGTSLTAHYQGPDGVVAREDGMAVPKDDNANHVADGWEIEKKLAEKHTATWDGENQPDDFAMHGDGYGMYEEFRGFALVDVREAAKFSATGSGQRDKLVHTRLDPKRRDLLVAFDALRGDEQYLQFGALRFGQVAGVDVSFVASKDYLGPMKGDLDGAHPRKAGPNRVDGDGDGGADFREPQAAVWIVERKVNDIGGPGVTVSWFHVKPEDDNDWGMYYGSPLTTQQIVISRDGAEEEVGAEIWCVDANPVNDSPADKIQRIQAALDAHKELGMTRKQVQARAEAHKPELVGEMLAFTTLNELGHAIGAQHHGTARYIAEIKDSSIPADKKVTQAETYGGGTRTCPMCYWHFADGEAILLFLVGKWTPTMTAPGGASWSFCAENAPTMRVRGRVEDAWKARPKDTNDD